MGACVSKSEHGLVIQKSILGRFVPECELLEFESLWTIETYQLSRHIHIKAADATYVVLAGEVHAVFRKGHPQAQVAGIAKSSKHHHSTVQIFQPGDVIHLFDNKNRSNDGHIQVDDMTVSLLPKSAHGLSSVQVAILHTNDIQTFLNKNRSDQNVIQGLRWFFNLNLAALLKDKPMTLGFTDTELQILGPMLKLMIIEDGEPVQYENIGPIPETLMVKDPSVRRPFNHNIVHPSAHKPIKSPHILLGGQCLSLNDDVTIEDYRKTMKGTRGGISEMSFRRIASQRIKPMDDTAMAPVKQRSANILSKLSQFQPLRSTRIFNTGQSLDSMGGVLQPGAFFGLENHYFKDIDINTKTIVACADSVIGVLRDEALVAIESVAQKMYKNLTINFNLSLLDSFESMLLCRDMKEDDLVKLCSLMTHRICESKEEIYAQGDPPENLYIIVSGSVQEIVYEVPDAQVDASTLMKKPSSSSTRSSSKAKMVDDEILEAGHIFGEVAVLTDSPYSSTIITREPTVLLVVDKRTIRSVFDHDKSKLAELKIRIQGEDVELEYLLSHPKGYQLFVDFLEKEHASESLQFWYAADRFDEMHKRIWKDYEQIEAEKYNHVHHNHSVKDSMLIPSNAPLSTALPQVSMRRLGSSQSNYRRRGSSTTLNCSKSLDNNVKELHDVCQSIIEKFVVDGALQQVNIPGKMRMEVEKAFADWTAIPGIARSKSTVIRITKDIIDGSNMNHKLPVATGTTSTDIATTGDNSSNHSQESSPKLPPVATLHNNFAVHDHNQHHIPAMTAFDASSFTKVRDIFKRPKKEVYDLLKKDTYVRLKLTEEFQTFIASINKLASGSMRGSKNNTQPRAK